MDLIASSSAASFALSLLSSLTLSAIFMDLLFIHRQEFGIRALYFTSWRALSIALTEASRIALRDPAKVFVKEITWVFSFANRSLARLGGRSGIPGEGDANAHVQGFKAPKCHLFRHFFRHDAIFLNRLALHVSQILFDFIRIRDDRALIDAGGTRNRTDRSGEEPTREGFDGAEAPTLFGKALKQGFGAIKVDHLLPLRQTVRLRTPSQPPLT